MSFFTKPRLICVLLLAGIGVVLLVSYMINSKTERVRLYFVRSDGTTGTEERYMPRVPGKEFAVSLTEELLLGPFDRSFLRFCDSNLRPNRCFVRGDALYLDVPAQILAPQVKTPDIHTVYLLLQKNIFKNCRNIRSVHLYIDGVPAYQTAAPA